MFQNSVNNLLTRSQAVDCLVNKPYLFGNAVGFKLLTEMHNDWMKQMIFGTGDETLQAHRGSYKTTAVSVALADIAILFPNDKTMFMRKSDSDVKEIIEQTKKILENPVTKQIAHSLYGVDLKLLKSSATEIQTNLTNDPRGTSQLVGKGIKGSLTGKHFDRIFTDDIVNVQDRTSKAEREHTKVIYQELQNIKNRNGRIFNTGTPWHKDDCFSIMPEPIKFDYKQTGIISPQEIAELKERMLPSLFAANYELKHIASEDVIFNNPQTSAERSIVEQSDYCHIDAAYVDNADYTAFSIVRKVSGKYYVFGKLWHKAIDKVLPEIISLRKSFNAGRIYCEDNGDKGLLARDLRKMGERVVCYHEDENKFIKIVTYLKWEWKNVIFVDGTDEEYINQICEFNEFADHDDAPDSLASIIRRLYTRNDDARKIAKWD